MPDHMPDHAAPVVPPTPADSTSLLIGSFEAPLCPSGRVELPRPYRPHLAPAVLAPGFDQCLLLLPLPRWHALVQRLPLQAPDISEARHLRRKICASAVILEPDDQGSISLPADLCRLAGLGQRVVFAGLASHVELWAPDRWQAVAESFG
jgi:MraZ protein